MWEWRSLDAPANGPWSRAIQARTLVIGSVTAPGVHLTGPLDGSARARDACSHRRPVDVIVILGLMPVVDDAASISVWPKAFMHRWSVWSELWVGL